MYPGIELRLYRYVSVLAEELNFTQAAMRQHISQPTLSTQIRDLEREIDAKLFERTRGGQQVVLTASGEAFLPRAKPLPPPMASVTAPAPPSTVGKPKKPKLATPFLSAA